MKIKKTIVAILIMMFLLSLGGTSKATTQILDVIQQAQKDLTYPYNTSFPDRRLQYDGKVVYNLTALNEKVQSIEIDKLRTFENAQISNIILSGYPYKTPEELGCQDEFEAYLATQEAIYMDYEPRDLQNYTILNERGKRIYEVAKQIVQRAKQLSSINHIFITPRQEELIEDTNDTNYFMREYDITTSSTIATTNIKIVAGDGIKITDLNNQPKTDFKEKDAFKILVPKEQATQNISVKLEADFVKVKLEHGGTQNLQNNYGVVIVADEKEKVTSHIDIKTGELSTIQITNLAKDTQNPIVGAKFELLDSDYNKIQENLITNELGEIRLDNIVPNTYYIKQIQTIEGYSLMNYYIKVVVTKEDRIANVKVVNTKKHQEQVLESNEKEIQVEEENKEIKEVNNKEITNIYNQNITKEVTDNIKEKNFYYNRDFINKVRIKNIKNEQNNDRYENFLYNSSQEGSFLDNLKNNYTYAQKDWINFMELKTSGTSLQKLPKAGR